MNEAVVRSVDRPGGAPAGGHGADMYADPATLGSEGDPDGLIDLRNRAAYPDRRLPLQGMTALVTGADRAVGRRVALELVRAGSRIVLLGGDHRKLRAVADEALPDGTAVQLTARPGNLREVVSAADFFIRMDKPLDILVHAAYDEFRQTVADGPVDQLDHHYLVNLRSPYALTQQLLPVLKRSGGLVVFTMSDRALHAGAGDAHSGPSLFGLRALAESLRDECVHHGVRVTNVFASEVGDDAPADPLAHRQHLRPADVARAVLGVCSLGPAVELTELRVRPLQKVG